MEKPVVLITGCSSGIGAALAQEFARQGARVLATARNVERLDNLADAGMKTAALDVTSAKQITETVDFATKSFGRIDILVNNAGYAAIAPSVELSPDDLRAQLETNLIGPVTLLQRVASVMKDHGSGKIVNIGSISGVVATPFSGTYGASKAALHLIGDALRMELDPFGINVITVQPGAIRSGFGNAAAGRTAAALRSDSWYGHIRDSILQRAELSQADATPAADFARVLVRLLLRDNTPPVIRLGKKSTVLPMMKRLLPTRILDRIFMRRFGLLDMDRGES